MSMTWTGTNGFFTRMGLFAGAINEVNANQGSELNTRVTDIVAQYNTVQRDVLEGFYANVESYRNSPNSWLSNIVALARQTAIEQANDDIELRPSATLSAALTQIIEEMGDDSQTINRPTISVTVTPGASNVCDGIVIASLTDIDGTPMDMVFPETITATVTRDGRSGATAFQEPLTVLSNPSVSTLSYNWPQGSGLNQQIQFTNAATNGLISEGDFDGTWTGSGSNTPPSPWEIVAGVAGSEILRNNDPLRGSYCLEIVPDAVIFTTIRQPVAVRVGTVYAWNLFIKENATPSAGVLRVRLTDGSNTIQNDAGTNNSATLNLTTLTGSEWVNLSGFFQMPSVLSGLPTATIYFEIGLTTLLAGSEIYIDLVSMSAPTRTYPGGPYLAAFSGGANAVVGDTFSVAVANNATNNMFVRALDRLFDLRTSGFKFPSAATGTISDSLIT